MNLAASQVQEPSAPPAESTAVRIANRFILEERFKRAAPEELAPTAGVDVLLVRNDGWILSLVAIVDAEREPAKRLNLDRAGLLAAAEALASRRGLARVTVSVVEIRDALPAEAKTRLSALRGSLKTPVRTYIAVPPERRVWAQRRELFDDVRRVVRRSLERPEETSLGISQRAAPAQLPPERFPVATLGLLGVLAVVFVLEQCLPIAPGDGFDPSLSTLIALGAIFRPSMGGGHELYRLLTSALLHAGPEHILLNSVALLIGGVVLERLIGSVRLVALFFLAALGGSAGSLLLNAPGTVSVGASGAIMGLFAAALVLTLRLPSGTDRVHIQYRLLQMMVPGLLPIFLVHTGDHVDYGAHLGGAMVGFVCGLFLLLTWRKDATQPPFARASRALATVGMVLFVAAAANAAVGYMRWSDLMPADQLPPSEAELAQPEQLVRKYPKDPRPHVYMAAKLYEEDRNYPAAEQEARLALARFQDHRWAFTSDLEIAIRADLAFVLDVQGKKDEARVIAKPVCHLGDHGAIPEELTDFCS